MNCLFVKTPTREIFNAVSEYLESKGARWANGERPATGYAIYVDRTTRKLTFSSYEKSSYAKYGDESSLAGMVATLTPRIEVTVKVNGKISNEPLSVETARSLGLVR